MLSVDEQITRWLRVVGEFIVFRRKQLKISQGAIAKRLEVDQSTISNIENAKTVGLSLAQLVRISSALGLNLIDFLERASRMRLPDDPDTTTVMTGSDTDVSQARSDDGHSQTVSDSKDRRKHTRDVIVEAVTKLLAELADEDAEVSRK